MSDVRVMIRIEALPFAAEWTVPSPLWLRRLALRLARAAERRFYYRSEARAHAALMQAQRLAARHDVPPRF